MCIFRIFADSLEHRHANLIMLFVKCICRLHWQQHVSGIISHANKASHASLEVVIVALRVHMVTLLYKRFWYLCAGFDHVQ